MYSMCHRVTLSRDGVPLELSKEKNNGELLAVYAVNIVSSTLNLVDTAVITMPETIMNKVINYRRIMQVGDYIKIELGYDENYRTEFEGYIDRMAVEDSNMKCFCIDALYLFKKDVKNIQMKPVTMRGIAQYLVDQIDPSYKVICDFDVTYEKFVIHNATGFDVLKKLADETKANIYFRTESKELHIHPAFIEKGGDAVYSMQKNIESSKLAFKKAVDNKVQVIVEGTNVNGKVTRVEKGTTGGNSVTIKVGAVKESDLHTIADNAYKARNRDQYEGSFDAWLIPFVRSSYSVKIIDEDYPELTGKYYAETVETNYSDSGGVRTITLGVSLST